MVNSLRMLFDDDINSKPADIFRAAVTNDPHELERALSEGQTLDSVHKHTGLTPIIVALLEHSEDFLEVALKKKFDPWIRDPNQRLAIDHAKALGLRHFQRLLHEKMYYPGWRQDMFGARPEGPG